MPNHDNEATEMVEAYGQRYETAASPARDSSSSIQLADFLLKFIVIGWKMYYRIYCTYRLDAFLLLYRRIGHRQVLPATPLYTEHLCVINRSKMNNAHFA